MKTTSVTILKTFDIKYLFAALVSTCLITTLTHANPPPVTVAQPVQVKVVDPVTVTGKVDVGNKVEISGRVETINDALKIPFHFSVVGSDTAHKSLYKVPDGMRLTIESVSAYVRVSPGHKVILYLSSHGVNAGTQWNDHFLALQPQGTFFNRDVFVSSQNLKIILDSVTPQIEYSSSQDPAIGDIDVSLTINGYLEEVP